MCGIGITVDYDAFTTERRWQAAWSEQRAFATPPPAADRRDTYVLVSCPFTSGDAHMGHVRSYSIGDAYARFRRAQGDAVLFTLGFDAFGLPVELTAIERDLDPRTWVDRCAERMREQFVRLGLSFDWEREFLSCEPAVYRWSQWLFLELMDAGMVYRRDAVVDYCDSCATVLSDLQVVDNRCWRCHEPVRMTRRTQWFLRGSRYNDENHERLAELRGWNDRALQAQRATLGPIEGVEVDAVLGGGSTVPLFTPFREHVGAASFVLLSPNHPRAGALVEDHDTLDIADELRRWAHSGMAPELAPVRDTGLDATIEGIPQALPVLISPSVDARYGATAVLGIPAVDKTDRAIAERLSGWWQEPPAAPGAVPARPATRYRTGDFPISRQRAWGVPIPLVHCAACGTVQVPREQLPVELPAHLRIAANGNALAADDAFMRCRCPGCGKPARRETDTLDCHFDAAWQQLPQAAPKADRDRAMFAHEEMRRWLPVHCYIQGADTGPFIRDERTVAKALRDAGHMRFLADGEPYVRMLTHDMVRLAGQKMSKHLGNTVTPAELVEQVGADVVRFSVLHAAAPAKPINWSDAATTIGTAFLQRTWEFAEPRMTGARLLYGEPRIETDDPMRRRFARLCAGAAERITLHYERLAPHQVTRELMRLLDQIETFERRARARHGEILAQDGQAIYGALRTFVQLLAPVAPHLAEELWERSGEEALVAQAPWPVAPSLVASGAPA